jgi:hypothetical protein
VHELANSGGGDGGGDADAGGGGSEAKKVSHGGLHTATA